MQAVKELKNSGRQKFVEICTFFPDSLMMNIIEPIVDQANTNDFGTSQHMISDFIDSNFEFCGFAQLLHI